MWETIFIQPLYNALVWLTQALPGASLGIAVILLTLLVRFILVPFSYKATKAQILNKKLEPEVKKIRETYKDDKEKQAAELIALYKDKKVNPFSGCLLILIQLPVILAVYTVFLNWADLSADLLYPFITITSEISTLFAGMDLTARSIVLALLAGGSQWLHLYFSPTLRSVKSSKTENTEEENDKESKEVVEADTVKPAFDPQDIAQNLQKHMRIFLPIMIVIIAMTLPGAVALYWVVTNFFIMAQEQFIHKGMKDPVKS